MFWSLVRKDILHLIRMKRELLVLLLMPAILIALLSFALGGMMDVDRAPLDIEMAVFREGDAEKEWEQFKRDVTGSHLPPEVQEMILHQAEQFSPTDQLVHQVLQGEKLKDSITIHEAALEEKESIRKEERYTALLTIPEDFDSTVLRSLFLGQNKKASLELELSDAQSYKGEWLKSIIQSYQEQVNLAGLAHHMLSSNAEKDANLEQKLAIEGETITLKGRKPLSSFAYYAVAMSVMFVFYTASFMARVAIMEKENRVLDRIKLAKVPIWKFLTGKWISASLVVIVQLLLLYGYAALAFQVYWSDLFSFFLVTILFSLVVGGISVLLTVLSYRFHSSKIESTFSSSIVVILSLFGGSFVRLDLFLGSLARIGNYTPNGAALNAYIKVMQGYSLSEISHSLLVLSAFIGVLLLLIFLIQERRVAR